MIGIVMKPVHGAPSVKGEGLYDAVFRGNERLFRVRARNAAAAEEKIMVAFRHELAGKTVSFRAEDFPEYLEPRKEDENGMHEEDGVPGVVAQGRPCVPEVPPGGGP